MVCWQTGQLLLQQQQQQQHEQQELQLQDHLIANVTNQQHE